jgi:Icc-related predicted phosphoesterase
MKKQTQIDLQGQLDARSHVVRTLMKLTVISDLHDNVSHAAVLRKACVDSDALIVCGDFTTFGDRERIQTVADAVAAENLPRFFVIGNCDAMDANGTLSGWENLNGRIVTLDSWFLAGLGGSLPCPGHTPSEFQEAAFERRLSEIRETCGGRADRLILVSHQPPLDTDADCLPSGLHVGCQTLRRFIDEVQPACCLTGHIHEAASRSKVGRTVLLNPGPFSKGNIATLEL